MSRTLFARLVICVFLVAVIGLEAAETDGKATGRKIAASTVKKLTGATVTTYDMLNKEGLTIVDFWAMWCKPCLTALDNIAENYEEWQEETGVKLVAISIDDARSAAKLPAFVNAKKWPYEMYRDENSDFKRTMSVIGVPHTFLVAPDGTILWEHTSYIDGDENELFELIKNETAKLKK